ncbi:MAG TPA: VanZ family protein [Ignavibacteriaceae bacterium]|nr:VanZ family protein [Ignavibacteriaceae bacterium]
MFEFLEKRKVWLVYVPLTIYWLVLFTATTIPVERLPSVGFGDKVNHFLAYFVLAVLIYLALIYQRKSKFLFEKAAIVTIVIGLFYGAVDELHQLLVPGRYAEIMDWVADALGTFAGVLIVYFLINRLRYRLEFD